jgi:hypothetical protein
MAYLQGFPGKVSGPKGYPQPLKGNIERAVYLSQAAYPILKICQYLFQQRTEYYGRRRRDYDIAA